MSELKDKLIEKILPHVRFQSRDIAHQLIVDLCTATGLTPEILEQIADGRGVVVPSKRGNSETIELVSYYDNDQLSYVDVSVLSIQLNRPVVKS